MDELVTKAAEAVGSIVVEFALRGGGKIAQYFLKKVPETTKGLIFQASQKYVENYSNRHGLLKVLWMPEPVKLESIYTTVQFLGDESIRRFQSLEALEQHFRQIGGRGFQSLASRQDGLEVAIQKQYLMVLGGPGSGKSTFLRRVGWEVLHRRKGGFIPVFIELKRFNSTEIDLEGAIAEEMTICGFPSPEKTAKRLLEKGKFFILLDGLDEVPTAHQDKVIIRIQDFVDRHDKNHFIASCRTAAYQSHFQRFTDLELADFDDNQIQQFINNWFSSPADKQADTARLCWSLLQNPDYQATKELAHTPLLLTFLCLVFDDAQLSRFTSTWTKCSGEEGRLSLLRLPG